MSENNEALRQAFKYLNKFMVWQWRLGLGRVLNIYPPTLGRYMVLQHIGRKSGKPRYNPVNYTEHDGAIYCVAGFGKVSDWYQNIQANPQIQVWLPEGAWHATAEIVPPHYPEALHLKRLVLLDSGFAAEAFGGINPHTMTAQELAHATAEYVLIRICRTTPAPDPATWRGAWAFPLGLALLGMLLKWYSRKPKPTV